MADSDDDFMSDKFLGNNVEDIRPGLVFNRTAKRHLELDKKRLELQEAKKPKSIKEREIEAREKGLNTAISSDNKGFKLLTKMGFKPGEGLGKNQTGRVEPIKVEVKAGKSGLGTETRVREKIQMKKHFKEEDVAKKLDEFKNSNREKQAMKFLQKDFYTCQKICEDLDNRKELTDPVLDYYWTRDTIKKRRKLDEEDDEQVEMFMEEMEDYVCNENLTEVINYLRSKHLYCIFCAFIANDEEDLATNCPGPYRIDHDDS